MPNTLDQWELWFPDDTSPVSPLENLFSAAASSVAIALTELSKRTPFQVANDEERDDLYVTPQVGERVFRRDTMTEEIYLNSAYGGTAGWKPWNSVPRSFTPVFSGFNHGGGANITGRWFYENGYAVVTVASVLGSSPGWSNPTMDLPAAIASWYDSSGNAAPKIGDGQFDNTEGNPGGRFQLSIIASGGNARIGVMQTEGAAIIWGGLGEGSLGIDQGDRFSMQVRYPTF